MCAQQRVVDHFEAPQEIEFLAQHSQQTASGKVSVRTSRAHSCLPYVHQDLAFAMAERAYEYGPAARRCDSYSNDTGPPPS